MFAPDLDLDMDAVIQRLHGQNALAAEMHTGVLTSKDWNKIWVQQPTEDQPRVEASVPSFPSKSLTQESSPSSVVSPETTGNESMTTRSATTNHATRQPPPSLDALAVPCQSGSDDGSESSLSATTSSAVSRATGTPASSIVSSTSPADDGADQNQNQTLHGESFSEIDVASFGQQRLRMAGRPPAKDAAKLKSRKRGMKRVYEDEDGNDKERPSTKRARDATADPTRARHLVASAHESGVPGTSAKASRALGDLQGPSILGGVHEDNGTTSGLDNSPAQNIQVRVAGYDTAARTPAGSSDGIELGQVVAGGTLPDVQDIEEPQADQQGRGDAQSSAAAQANLGHGAQDHNNLLCTPGQAVADYAADADRLRAQARIATRVLELTIDPNTPSLPNAVPRALSKVVEASVKDALRGMLGIPLNGSQPGWTNCDACFETYRTRDAAKHSCTGEQFTACRVCGCPIVRGDNAQLRRHHVSKCPLWHALVHRRWHIEWLDREGFVVGKEGQFFDKAAQRVADAEADAPTVPDASKPTVLRNALLRELKVKEIETIEGRMSVKNPLGGIRPKARLTDAVVDEIRAEIRRENTTGGQQGSSTRL
ncbi:hypothetical protein AURDEDRAFT_159272 [Auricularia subglabra TFB-10046 SS5]|nr:hypothetical protein AURDEDRAFT_159272 [Auricularia subglabra TFB-10046 SS5]